MDDDEEEEDEDEDDDNDNDDNDDLDAAASMVAGRSTRLAKAATEPAGTRLGQRMSSGTRGASPMSVCWEVGGKDGRN